MTFFHFPFSSRCTYGLSIIEQIKYDFNACWGICTFHLMSWIPTSPPLLSLRTNPPIFAVQFSQETNNRLLCAGNLLQRLEKEGRVTYLCNLFPLSQPLNPGMGRMGSLLKKMSFLWMSLWAAIQVMRSFKWHWWGNSQNSLPGLGILLGLAFAGHQVFIYISSMIWKDAPHQLWCIHSFGPPSENVSSASNRV